MRWRRMGPGHHKPWYLPIVAKWYNDLYTIYTTHVWLFKCASSQCDIRHTYMTVARTYVDS